MPLLKYAGIISGVKLAPADKEETKLIFNFTVKLRSEVGFSSMPAIAKLTGKAVYISIYGDQLIFPETDDDLPKHTTSEQPDEIESSDPQPNLFESDQKET